jgi:TolB-like protein/DNA-binding winged helix-turn-helix (wHTH) protein
MEQQVSADDGVTGAAFIIAGWSVEPSTLRIRKQENEVKLEPKAMAVLVYLADRPGQVVSRQELEEAVWAGTVVGYDAISNAVIKLRKAFGDDAQDPKIIETIPKSGYRLIAPVEPRVLGDDYDDEPRAIAPADTRANEPSPAFKIAFAISVPLLLLIVIVMVWLEFGRQNIEAASIERMAHPLPDKPSIAVMPFTNMSADPDQDYFVDGMTEDLITDLSKLEGLFVVARNSVFTYKDRSVKVGRIAEELGVRFILEGSVRRADDTVRVNAHLVDATTGGHVWTERYDGLLGDVFSIQDEITRNIVSELEPALTGRDEEKLAVVVKNNPAAYDAFLRGWQRYRQGTPEDFVKAATFFKQAIKIDPDFARAYSALAAVYWNITVNGWSNRLDLLNSESWQQTRDQTREQTRLMLKKAIELEAAMDRPSALTHRIASERFAYLHRRPERALAEAEMAIEIDANDPAGHLAMAAALIKAGRALEAVESARIAMRLDPRHPASYLTRLGEAQFIMGQYEIAVESFEKAARLNPDNDWNFVYLAAAYGQLGRMNEATRAVERANALRARSGWGALTTGIVSRNYRLGIRGYYFKWFGDYKPLREGLSKAGVPYDVNWRGLVSTGPSGMEIKGATSINAETARTLHQRGVPFIDIWTTWSQKRIPGSTMLSLLYQGFNEAMLPAIAGRSEEVVIYGSGDHEGYARWAPQAVARAVLWGYENVYYFEDGLEQWEAAGYPVDSESALSNE